jgi:hypothetical protein
LFGVQNVQPLPFAALRVRFVQAVQTVSEIFRSPTT